MFRVALATCVIFYSTFAHDYHYPSWSGDKELKVKTQNKDHLQDFSIDSIENKRKKYQHEKFGGAPGVPETVRIRRAVVTSTTETPTTSYVFSTAFTKCSQYTGSNGAIGGTPVEPGEFPHMAIIGWRSPEGNYTFKCGGSLISRYYVLTAAHCLKASNKDTSIQGVNPVVVRLGEISLAEGVDDGSEAKDYGIVRTVKHPMYKPPKKYYDIGLIQLDKYVYETEYIRPACLALKDGFMEEYVNDGIVTGWGATKSGSTELSTNLLKVRVDLLDSALCDKLLRSVRGRTWSGFAPHQLCAGVLAGNADACQGDSGGPFQRSSEDGKDSRFTIMGITSFGYDCGKPNRPGVYTRVDFFTPWIETVVWPDGADDDN